MYIYYLWERERRIYFKEFYVTVIRGKYIPVQEILFLCPHTILQIGISKNGSVAYESIINSLICLSYIVIPSFMHLDNLHISRIIPFFPSLLLFRLQTVQICFTHVSIFTNPVSIFTNTILLKYMCYNLCIMSYLYTNNTFINFNMVLFINFKPQKSFNCVTLIVITFFVIISFQSIALVS